MNGPSLAHILSGELVLSTVADVLKAVRQVTFPAGEIVLDGSSLTRVDLAGLQLLVAAGKSAAGAGGALRIDNSSDQLRDAERRAGLSL
jgi:ABC-type transporter Mla MlaB component